MSETTTIPTPAKRPGRPKGYSPQRPRTGTVSGATAAALAELAAEGIAPPGPEQAQADYASNRAAVAELVREGHLQVQAPQTRGQDDDWEQARQRSNELRTKEARRLNLLRAQELHDQAEHASKKRKGLPPVSAMPRRQMIDATVQLDADGKPAGTPGYLQKWVPLVDMNGREVSPEKSYAIQQHRNDGFRFVEPRDGSGEHFTGPLGVFMEIEPIAAVHREFAYGGSTIAVNPEDYNASEAIAEINAANRAAGPGQYVRSYTHDDHGRHQSGSLDD